MTSERRQCISSSVFKEMLSPSANRISNLNGEHRSGDMFSITLPIVWSATSAINPSGLVMNEGEPWNQLFIQFTIDCTKVWSRVLAIIFTSPFMKQDTQSWPAGAWAAIAASAGLIVITARAALPAVGPAGPASAVTFATIHCASDSSASAFCGREKNTVGATSVTAKKPRRILVLTPLTSSLL